MTCIRCGQDSKYKERVGMRCPKCHGDFAFEPKAGALLTDKAFQSAIDAVSSNEQVRWGVEHLYYEICRRYRRRRLFKKSALIIIGCISGVLLVVGVLAKNPIGVFGLIGVLGTLVGWLVRKSRAAVKTVPLALETFNAMWARWTQTHGTPKSLIIRKPQLPKPRAKESDLGDYSFDRAVICDRARTVDLLLANNFHFENNCAVLAIGGYPEGPFETVRAMLKRNPRLQVFALHDASLSGCKMAYRLANDPAWFKGQVPVIDVGLRPVHTKPFQGLWLPAHLLEGHASEGVTGAEAQWLAGHTLELAAIRPEQIIKRLFRAMNRKTEGVRGDSSSGDGGSSGGYDTTSSSITGSGAHPVATPESVAPGMSFQSAGHGVGEPGAPGMDFVTPGDGGAVGYDFDSFSADAGDSDGGADSFG